MKIRFVLAVITVAALVAVFGYNANAQTNDDLDEQISAVRADLKADKMEITQEAMQLSPEEGKAFWPVYKQYEREVSAANDDLVQLVKSYAEKFGTIGDVDARDLTMKALAVQSKKIELKKKYFPLFSKATSALIAAKFFQVDYRLELLFNLKLASELPALLIQPAPSRAPGSDKGK